MVFSQRGILGHCSRHWLRQQRLAKKKSSVCHAAKSQGSVHKHMSMDQYGRSLGWTGVQDFDFDATTDYRNGCQPDPLRLIFTQVVVGLLVALVASNWRHMDMNFGALLCVLLAVLFTSRGLLLPRSMKTVPGLGGLLRLLENFWGAPEKFGECRRDGLRCDRTEGGCSQELCGMPQTSQLCKVMPWASPVVISAYVACFIGIMTISRLYRGEDATELEQALKESPDGSTRQWIYDPSDKTIRTTCDGLTCFPQKSRRFAVTTVTGAAAAGDTELSIDHGSIQWEVENPWKPGIIKLTINDDWVVTVGNSHPYNLAIMTVCCLALPVGVVTILLTIWPGQSDSLYGGVRGDESFAPPW